MKWINLADRQPFDLKKDAISLVSQELYEQYLRYAPNNQFKREGKLTWDSYSIPKNGEYINIGFWGKIERFELSDIEWLDEAEEENTENS